MLHIELPPQRHTTHDIDLDHGMFRRNCAHYSLSQQLDIIVLCEKDCSDREKNKIAVEWKVLGAKFISKSQFLETI